MENHGTEFKSRFRRLREQVLAMQGIWTRDEPEFHGEFVNFDPIWYYPKPVKQPHSPVLFGGESDFTLQRVVDFCDGWLSRTRGNVDIAGRLAELKARAARAGRDTQTMSVNGFGAKPDAATLDSYATAGVTRALFDLPSKDRESVLPLLDQYAKLIR